MKIEKNAKTNSFDHSNDKIAPLLQQLEYLCPTSPVKNNELPTESASIYSKKKEHRGLSLVERPKTSLLTLSKSTVKPRIKSSMTNLSKHFTQNKIEYRNFMQKNAKILASTEHLLKKRGKLQLWWLYIVLNLSIDSHKTHINNPFDNYRINWQIMDHNPALGDFITLLNKVKDQQNLDSSDQAVLESGT